MILAQLPPPDKVFYTIQGADTGMRGQLLTGNIPIVASPMILRSLALGLLLLLLVSKVCQLISQSARHNHWQPRSWKATQLGIFLLFFLSFELLLRLPYYCPQEQFIPDPRTFWSANPQTLNYVQALGTGVIGLDRQPFTHIFDQEFPQKKTDNVYRIVFMGDSQAISCHPKMYSRKSYPKRLGALLAQEQLTGPGGRSVQCINAAMSGFSSWQGLILLKSDILAYKPDVLVEAFGYHDANDATCSDTEVITDNPIVWRIRQLMYSSRICLLLRTIVLRRQAAIVDRITGDKVVHRVPLPQYAKNLQAMAELGHRNGFRLVLLIEPTNDYGQDPRSLPYSRLVHQVAQQYRLPVIDAKAHFDKLKPQERSQLFQDYVHLTTKGHEVMARLVLEELQKQQLLLRTN